ncbi:MAG: UTP--glucose-phosphate uridylyltransferase [Verrucomicrobiota bacterium]|jgi:galactokinase/mevalonate kinase-like predicted kinase
MSKPSILDLITSPKTEIRNQPLEQFLLNSTADALLHACTELDAFRRNHLNLYERVRALFFLYAIHRFHLPPRLQNNNPKASIPFDGHEHLLNRRFEEAIDAFLHHQRQHGPGDGISSALAAAYHRLAFQTLANQVRKSVRSVAGNQWMFRTGHPADQPLRIRPELLQPHSDGTYPILKESTPVRMDLSHCGWSDIFFLAMDYPEGAQVLNVSIDLGVHGRDASPRPPVEAYLRVIDEPVLRLTSVDLGATADITSLAEIFDFARDYLGLLKAAVIAGGIVPPGLEGSGQHLDELLTRLCGPGRGLELVSRVNDIPKGSRLAVSTNLLAALISACMRATRQTASLTGSLQENERRIVLARALLGEWLGGSGGGWQDSGGVWPGVKLINGMTATDSDPEHSISRGRLMPKHHILTDAECSAQTRQKLQDSLVLVHGGMAQNVGPILEMVTEKYLLRSGPEWNARQAALDILQELLQALRQGDVAAMGRATSRNFQEPLQTIIPWASNHFTETLIHRTKAAFKDDYWGFWMLGGMSGGGMGFMFAPHRKAEAQQKLQEIMNQAREELQHALPFAMNPVVYDFAINERGTWADLLSGENALMPPGYYTLTLPSLLQRDRTALPPARRRELDKFGAACRNRPELSNTVQALFDILLPKGQAEQSSGPSLPSLLQDFGFDRIQHEQIRSDLRNGRIGLAQNRLRPDVLIEDVHHDDVTQLPESASESTALSKVGLTALQQGEVAVVTLAAGAASRWTQGAGVVKALNPFCKMAGSHRSFLEIHLAKTLHTGHLSGTTPAHILTTSYLSHTPIQNTLNLHQNYGFDGPLLLSPGKSIGLRLIPTVRDLKFAWEEMPQQVLDQQQQKVRESLRTALQNWARSTGETNDYTDNLPLQCLHPVGHWFEIPNLLRNGTLAKLLAQQPNLKYLLLHNIDTLGANLDPAILGLHIQSKATLSFEVITRRLEDRGGGLARINGKPRLVEGLALPDEREEFKLTYYNTLTTWIDLDQLLSVFELNRNDFLPSAPPSANDKIQAGIRKVASRMPTYITLKDVKKRWGHGQEDVFPVAQFEKLWGDMTTLPEIQSSFIVVPRNRGQQLKDPAQLDGWLRDGSAAYVEDLCHWT